MSIRNHGITSIMKRKMLVGISILGVLILAIIALLNHPALGRTPRGERLARIERSPNYKKGQFANQEPTPFMTTDKSRWRIIWDNLTKKKPDNLAPSESIRAVKTDLNRLDLSRDAIVWFGHSSYLLIYGGRKILVDPVLTTGFPSSLMMKPFKGTDIYSPEDIPDVDYLIITHDHYDHLDYGTVKAIRDRVGKVICPLGVGEHLEYWGYPAGRIVEMDWNEVYVPEPGFRITCLTARHFSGRFLRQNPSLWASFMLEGDATVYIGGDSGYGKHFAEIGKRFPHIDLAILENGQYNEDWRYIHTMPDQLPKEIHELNAAKVFPVHNSKFSLSRHAWDEPVRKIEEAAAKDSGLHVIHGIIGTVKALSSACSPNTAH